MLELFEDELLKLMENVTKAKHKQGISKKIKKRCRRYEKIKIDLDQSRQIKNFYKIEPSEFLKNLNNKIIKT